MPIEFDCPCGKALRVADEYAGRKVKCPACGAVGFVPEPEPQFEVVEDEPPSPPAKAAPAKKSAWDDDDEDDGRGYGVAKSNRGDEDDEDEKPKKKLPNFRESSGRDDDDDEDEKPKKKKKKKRRRPPPPREDNSGRSLEGGIINGGTGAGVLAMLIAVVWFIAGLANDIIFFYPPVLFVIGLVAFFKGMADA